VFSSRRGNSEKTTEVPPAGRGEKKQRGARCSNCVPKTHLAYRKLSSDREEVNRGRKGDIKSKKRVPSQQLIGLDHERTSVPKNRICRANLTLDWEKHFTGKETFLRREIERTG